MISYYCNRRQNIRKKLVCTRITNTYIYISWFGVLGHIYINRYNNYATFFKIPTNFSQSVHNIVK